MGRGAFVPHNTANYPAMQVLRGWLPAALFHSANPARRVVSPRRGSPVAPSVHLGTLTPVIGRERFEPSRRRGRSGLDGFGFGRRPHSDGDGGRGSTLAGRAFSSTNRHRPSSSFSTSSRPASRSQAALDSRTVGPTAADNCGAQARGSRIAAMTSARRSLRGRRRPWRVLPACGVDRGDGDAIGGGSRSFPLGGCGSWPLGFAGASQRAISSSTAGGHASTVLMAACSATRFSRFIDASLRSLRDNRRLKTAQYGMGEEITPSGLAVKLNWRDLSTDGWRLTHDPLNMAWRAWLARSSSSFRLAIRRGRRSCFRAGQNPVSPCRDVPGDGGPPPVLLSPNCAEGHLKPIEFG